jgi:hypothetical protein
VAAPHLRRSLNSNLSAAIVVGNCDFGLTMNSGTHFDIFTDSPDAQPMWIESTQNLEDARERLREVARIAPQRDCFVYSEESGIVELVLRANFQELRRAYSLTGMHGSARCYRSSRADPWELQAASDSGKH